MLRNLQGVSHAPTLRRVIPDIGLANRWKGKANVWKEKPTSGIGKANVWNHQNVAEDTEDAGLPGFAKTSTSSTHKLVLASLTRLLLGWFSLRSNVPTRPAPSEPYLSNEAEREISEMRHSYDSRP